MTVWGAQVGGVCGEESGGDGTGVLLGSLNDYLAHRSLALFPERPLEFSGILPVTH